MSSTWMRLLIGCLIGLACCADARAGDVFFAFGGGYAPPGNQVSLEKNMLYFQRFLKLANLEGAGQHYLFADGNRPNRDVKYKDPKERPGKLRAALATIFKRNEGIYFNYRTNRVPRLNGPCSIDAIDAWFNQTGAKLKTGDRLCMYFTGHGGRGPKNDPRNTTLQVWLGKTLSVKQFTQRLNRIPPKVPVVLLMVQCYAGGFANVIFNDGDPSRGMAEQPRAGFFASAYHQQAAGCTPDINEANYQEYSNFFWAALCGQSRLGKNVDKPDYNGDGKVDFSEAHAYAVLTDPTIDLPIKTSDVFLRNYSAAYPKKTLDKAIAARYVTPEIYSRLIEAATPGDRAVLEGLSEILKLSGDERTVAARQLSDETLKKRDEVNQRKQKIRGEFDKIRTILAHFLQEGWPELDNAWHPRVEKILREDRGLIWSNLERHPRFKQMKTLNDKSKKLNREVRRLDRKWAKCQRFLYLSESVARAANLSMVAPADVLPHYKRLIELESSTLGAAGKVDKVVDKIHSKPSSSPRIAEKTTLAVVAKPDKQSSVKGAFIYPLDGRPTAQCHASTIVETSSGLVAAWFGGKHESSPDVGIWSSRHVDGKWTAPVEVANGVQSPKKRYPCWNPVLFQPAKGPLMLFFKVGPSPSRWWGEMKVSSDGGKSWSEARKLGKHATVGHLLGPVKNKPIQLKDGSLLCGSSTEHQGWRVHFERTTDGGKTWQVVAPIHDGKKIGAIQPSVLTHRDGRLQALGRSLQGKIWQAFSTDAGKTWGKMTLMSLPNPNAGTDAVTLGDGRHLLVYNHTIAGGSSPRGREMLNVAVSDDGKNWKAALVLEKQPGEYSYPAVIQSGDGLVHVTYTYRRTQVKHVVIDPKKLKLREIVDGKWPN